MLRNPGDVVDPDLVWWKSRGPLSFQREPAPEEVVRRRIREEDEHVNRYVFMLDTPAVYDSRWMVLHRDPSHVSYVLWFSPHKGLIHYYTSHKGLIHYIDLHKSHEPFFAYVPGL